jgi:D-alanyl-D-alanine carboxypeptidase
MNRRDRRRKLPITRWPSPDRKLIPLALAAMLAVSVIAACGGTKARQVSPDNAAQLQRILNSAVKSPKTVFPGAALYVTQPKLGAWAGAAGEGTIHPATAMRAEDTFRAGSILKPFISTVVLQLTEEGKFALDDLLAAVLPKSVVARIADSDQITVRMLLNHTSGIPEYSDEHQERIVVADPHRVWHLAEILKLSAAHPRQFEPGKGWAYSNTDYNLLGLVIEKATGESWRAAVRERVIDPLKLKNTSLPKPGNVSIGSDAAHGYELLNGKLRDYTDVDPSMADAAGGAALVTTTKDLVHFLDALLAGELFEHHETLAQMLTFVKATDAPGEVGYGLGLERYEWPGGIKVIGHIGGTAGYLSFVGHVLAQDVDVAMVINTRDDPTPVLLPSLTLMVNQAAKLQRP